MFEKEKMFEKKFAKKGRGEEKMMINLQEMKRFLAYRARQNALAREEAKNASVI